MGKPRLLRGRVGARPDRGPERAAAAPSADVRFEGVEKGDLTGSALRRRCDVNGDGEPDAVIGAFGADDAERSSSGVAYVQFGDGAGGSRDLASPSDRRFRIRGEPGRIRGLAQRRSHPCDRDRGSRAYGARVGEVGAARARARRMAR